MVDCLWLSGIIPPRTAGIWWSIELSMVECLWWSGKILPKTVGICWSIEKYGGMVNGYGPSESAI